MVSLRSFKIDVEIDTGDFAHKESFEIGEMETTDDVLERFNEWVESILDSE